jgi:transcriptional regulator with XRE-family HTH domain
MEVNLDNETFGQRLKRLRQQHKLRSIDVAAYFKISLPYYSQMEADLAVPSEDLARKIARRFKEDEEGFVFLARRMPKHLQEIVQKFPNSAPAYFRRITEGKK